MIKRFTVSLLASLYLLVTSGLTVNLHYCLDKLSSASFSDHVVCICGDAGAGKKADGCCKDKKVSFSLRDAHFKDQKLPSTNIFLPDCSARLLSFGIRHVEECNVNKLPSPRKIHFKPPLFQLYRNYRI